MTPAKPARRVTLEDVARHAGVSRALVSIVMRGVKGAGEETRARVLESARELGYRPDVRARALAGQRSRLIGVTFGVTGSFHFDLLEGLYDAARSHGYDLVLSALTPGRDEQQAVDSLQDFRFDALVMLAPQTPSPLMAGVLPVVVVGWQVDDERVDVVRTSDDIAMRAAVDHLVDLGHRDIAHVGGGPGLVAASRRAAYASAMGHHGLDVHVRVVEGGGETQLDGMRAAHELLEGPLPTALVAYNDDVAVAVVGVLAQHGIDVPGELSVVGFDDRDIATLAAVPLTSVAQDPVALAHAAIDRAVCRADGREVIDRELVLDAVLRVRASTGPPPPSRPPPSA